MEQNTTTLPETLPNETKHGVKRKHRDEPPMPTATEEESGRAAERAAVASDPPDLKWEAPNSIAVMSTPRKYCLLPHQKLDCSYCGHRSSNRDLPAAPNRRHPSLYKFSCLTCSHRSSNRNSLALHYARQHGGPPPNSDPLYCSWCGFVPKTKGMRKRHLRSRAHYEVGQIIASCAVSAATAARPDTDETDSSSGSDMSTPPATPASTPTAPAPLPTASIPMLVLTPTPAPAPVPTPAPAPVLVSAPTCALAPVAATGPFPMLLAPPNDTEFMYPSTLTSQGFVTGNIERAGFPYFDDIFAEMNRMEQLGDSRGSSAMYSLTKRAQEQDA